MKTLYETSKMPNESHISCIKYRNLNNIAHYHSDFELIYINEGRASIYVNEKYFHLHKDDCVFVHSNDIHHIRSDKATVITVLKASDDQFGKLFASKMLFSPLLKDTSSAKELLKAVSSELKTRTEGFDVMADCMTTQFFITLLRNEQTCLVKSKATDKTPSNEIYNLVCEKISKEFSTVTFEEIAKYIHFSAPYFSKIFREQFGMTFTQYLNTVKIAKAIEAIKEGKQSITSIAAKCGFNTQRNFNRVFKSFTGYSPSNLPPNYVFLFSLQDGRGLNPTLNCTEIIEE